MLRRTFETINFETQNDYEIEVTKFTDISCKSLEEDVRKKHSPRRSHINTRQAYGQAKVEIIEGPD